MSATSCACLGIPEFPGNQESIGTSLRKIKYRRIAIPK